MAAPRNLVVEVGGLRDEENGEDSPTSKKPIGTKLEGKFPLSRWEFAAALAVFFIFSMALFFIFMTMPAAEYGKLKFPRTVSDLRALKNSASALTWYKMAGFLNSKGQLWQKMYRCVTIVNSLIWIGIHMTFMIPGTIFMSLLAGALFGVVRGLFLVVFNATAGASSCFFLSKLIGRPVVNWLWPEKLRYFQGEIAKRREKLLNYMLFLRITPSLPNLFINLASPIVDIPFHVFLLATIIGLIPASYITVRAGLALGDLKSVKDLYDFKTLSVLFLIGSVVIVPTLLKRKRPAKELRNNFPSRQQVLCFKV
ncbi:unnamed protein product [Camellia sinensis]